MPKPTIAAGFVRALLELAVSKGANPEVLAERSGIDPAGLEDQDNRIPFAKYVALMRAAKELCNDSALALHFGEAFDMADLSIIGLIGRASATMADAFVQTNRYAKLMVELDCATEGDRFALARDNGLLWMIDTRANPNDFPEHTEANFARMVCTSRRWVGHSEFMKAVHFTHPAPACRAEYDRIFQMPVVFESDKNALVTDETWLTLKTAHASRYVFGVLSDRADALVATMEGASSLKGRVEALLLPALHTGNTSMDTIAVEMGMSRRTLSRRLKAEEVTYETVLDALRHKMALHYLSGKKVSVNETAYLVGFSDPAAFSRAFKRWTGKTPRTVRS